MKLFLFIKLIKILRSFKIINLKFNNIKILMAKKNIKINYEKSINCRNSISLAENVIDTNVRTYATTKE